MSFSTLPISKFVLCSFRSSEWKASWSCKGPIKMVPTQTRQVHSKYESNKYFGPRLLGILKPLSKYSERRVTTIELAYRRSTTTSKNFRNKKASTHLKASKGTTDTKSPPSKWGSAGPEVKKTTKRTTKRKNAYSVFGGLLLRELAGLKRHLLSAQYNRAQAWGIKSNNEMDGKMKIFREMLIDCVASAEEGNISLQNNHLFYRLRNAFVTGQLNALKHEMQYQFINSFLVKEFTRKEANRQAELADLRFPNEWYPATRAVQRTIHLHVGPTNSGKTYHALQRLAAVENGVYAGPLRLLAHEVYSRFNAKGKKCALITGEERRIPPDMTNTMCSCTVEMIPLNTNLDVAVIDEIQMMGDPDRGWAWTAAFLGVKAKEVHLCGEMRTVKLVKDLCALMGDKLVIHQYQRLSPLEMDTNSLQGDLRNLRKGDAIILFSRLAIHGMKQSIEDVTGTRCAVVYGSLPPETRAQQAALFNDPNNDYDYLVASDAVGMGLNLSIRRVIFESTAKYDGSEFRVIHTHELKQIAGRAGRYRTAQEATSKDETKILQPGSEHEQTSKTGEGNVGLVTTFSEIDFSVVKQGLKAEPEPLKTAGIYPPTEIILRFSSYFPPSTPFSYVLLRLQEIATTSPQFYFCQPRDQILLADLIQPFNLSTMERIIFTAAPVSLRDEGFPNIVTELAACLANRGGGDLLDLRNFRLELLDLKKEDYPGGTKAYLRAAETLHKALTLYLWLSYRFAGVYRSQALAFHVKGLVEERIDECLAEVKYNPKRRKDISEKSRLRQVQEQAARESLLEAELDEHTNAYQESDENTEQDTDDEIYDPAYSDEIAKPEERQGKSLSVAETKFWEDGNIT